MDSQFPSSFFFSILFIISMEIRSSWSQNPQFQNCVNETIQCGNINIGYPFYGQNRPSYCGHPGFELYCNGKNLEITIDSIKHYVLSVDTAATTLTVAREDYWPGHCPASLVNTTIDFSLFSYTNEDENITIYYNCSSSTSSSAGWQSSQFMCPGSTATGYFSAASGSNGNLEAGCSSSVFVPVYKSVVAKMDGQVNQGTLMAILSSGFGLQWFADNNRCDDCQKSGGECGYDWNNGEFQCYCSSDSSRCRQTVSGSKSKKTGVGVGIATGVVGIIALLGCWSFFILRRRKRLISHAKSKDLHSTPSNSNTDSNRDLPSSNGFTTTQTTSGFFTTTHTTTDFTTAHTTSYSQNIPSYASSKLKPEKGSNYFGVQVFSYTELEEATNNFDKSRELGDGGFGAVYYGELPDGRAVAVKRLYENNYKRVGQFMNEIEIIARLCHKNLVTLYGCTSKRSQELILVYEYISNGTVADHLHGKRSELQLLTWPIRLNVAVQTADALAYLHASDVIHRDVKTTNILLDGNFQVKVADFGLSRLFPNHATHVSTAPQGSPGYVDPEYYNLFRLTEKSDVYSFGVVLIELISSKEAMDTSRRGMDANLACMAVDRIQKNKEFHELVDPRLGFEEDYNVQETIKLVLELAFQCLQQERDLRPSMMEAFLVLKGIQKRFSSQQKQVMVDIKDEDLALLKNVPPPLSPETRVVISKGRR
ncbi:hypothetical protein Nepgr_022503 [Nepenthes gracilis]|uniref:non-specific serine/threonine protein kinase n=1 Tax=Nepenthes gracilis TaxID=150966 RepID=A0AAD3T132_NEPGR|nr:hypothetical protein Nepgr_022503 [Nepenthes gracilis]